MLTGLRAIDECQHRWTDEELLEVRDSLTILIEQCQQHIKEFDAIKRKPRKRKKSELGRQEWEMINLYRKLTQIEAEQAIRDIEKWFAEHPKRQVVYTEVFRVRRGHIKEDILAHSINVGTGARPSAITR